METAQESFKRLLRDRVAPVLRAEGLRGSGASFVLPDPTWWAQVGFQKSKWNNADEVTFTVNLTLTDKAWWDHERREHSPMHDHAPPGTDQAAWDAERLARSAYPVRPSPNVFNWGNAQRIGHLMPGVGKDHWWTLSADNADTVMEEALQALVARAAVASQSTPAGVATRRPAHLVRAETEARPYTGGTSTVPLPREGAPAGRTRSPTLFLCAMVT